MLSRQEENLVASWSIGPRMGSDHHIIYCKLKVPRPEVQKEEISFRNFKNIDLDAFKNDFWSTMNCEDCISEDDVNSVIINFENALSVTVDKHAPVIKKTRSSRIHQPWYSNEIHEARRVRRRYEKQWRKTGLEVHHQLYLEQLELVNTMIENAKKVYLQGKLKDADSKSMFRTVNSLLNNNNKILPSHDSLPTLCDNFATFFKEKVDKIQEGLEQQRNSVNELSVNVYQSHVSCTLSEFDQVSVDDVMKIINGFAAKHCILDSVPTWFLKSNCEVFVNAITKIVKLSLSTGVFPDSLKHAIIGPLIKKSSLDRNILKNYRPVSNIKFLSKVIEKIVVSSITKHMQDNNLGEPLQSAYRAAHSTETALLKVKDDIMTSLHHRQGVFLVLLDLSAAFDTVNHNILFQRMNQELGISGTALQWMKSYFSGRTTSVCVNGCQSAKCALDYGLPQGSIVGPVSFSIYTIPIGRIIREHRLSYHLYADDVQLYTNFDPACQSSIDRALSSLTSCIGDIQSWMTCNMLQLNREKTEFFIAASSHVKNQMPAVTLQIGSEAIEPSETVRNLGVIFDNSMTMRNQISSLTRSVSFHLRNISRIRRFLDFDTSNDIIRSLILSRLDYGNVLLMGANTTDIARLQTLQNWAAKIIFCAKKRDHVSPLLHQLHWLSVEDRITFKAMLYVFKCLAGIGPEYLSSCLELKNPREGLRSASDRTRLNVPIIRSWTFKSAADKAFTYNAPLIWNNLPSSVRSAQTVSAFKKGLKTHLFPQT